MHDVLRYTYPSLVGYQLNRVCVYTKSVNGVNEITGQQHAISLKLFRNIRNIRNKL